MRLSTSNVGANSAAEMSDDERVFDDDEKQRAWRSEIRTARGRRHEPSIMRILKDEILTIDGQILKNLHILIPRWLLTAQATEAIDASVVSAFKA